MRKYNEDELGKITWNTFIAAVIVALLAVVAVMLCPTHCGSGDATARHDISDAAILPLP